jgi:uncharacterized protein
MELTLFVDHQCNLRCTYCYNGEKFSRRMSREVLEKAARLALGKARGELHVSFFGGEPLLHPDFVEEAIELFEREAPRLSPGLALRYIMNTNGTLLDERAIRLLRSRPFVVNISLDGAPEVHDKVRLTAGGRGTYAVVEGGIRRLRDEGVRYQLLSVVGPWGARELGRTVETALALEPEKLQLSIDYRAAWTEESLGWLRDGLHDAGDAWMASFRAGRAVPLNPLHAKILAHLHGGMPCASRCLLANGELTVAPSGNLYPCGQMVGEDDDPKLVIGHVDGGVTPSRVDALQAARDRIDETFGDCELVDRCQSQCGCRHVALTGELGRITAALCETEAAFVEEADRVAEALYAEQCRAFLAYYYERSWAPTAGAKLVTLRRAAPGVDASRS